MKKHVLRIIPLAIGASILPFVTAAAAQKPQNSTTFVQQILPLNCIFMTVDTGLGTIRYITPQECGQIIEPSSRGTTGTPSKRAPQANQPQSAVSTAGSPHTPVQQRMAQSTAPHLPVPSQSLSSDTFINNHPPAQIISGYTIDVAVGDTLTYVPLTENGSGRHDFIVTSIGQKSVTLWSEPSKQAVTISPYHIIAADNNKQGRPAIAIEVSGTPVGATVQLRIWLLSAKLTVPDILHATVQPEHQAIVSAAIIAAFMVVLAAITARQYRRRHAKQK